MQDTGNPLAADATHKRRTYGAGDVLWRKGDPSDFVCLIESGTLALFHVNENGDETFVANFGPGHLVGENALYGSEPRSTTVKAVDGVVVIATDAEEIRAKVAAFDTISAVIIQNLLDKMKIMSDMLARQTDVQVALPEHIDELTAALNTPPDDADEQTPAEYTIQERTYAAGEVLWRRGDPSDSVCLIISGAVALYGMDETGAETHLSNFTHNQMIGENALYGSEPRSTNAQAVSDATVLVTNGEEIRKRIARHDTPSALIIKNLLLKMKIMASLLDIGGGAEKADAEETPEEKETPPAKPAAKKKPPPERPGAGQGVGGKGSAASMMGEAGTVAAGGRGPSPAAGGGARPSKIVHRRLDVDETPRAKRKSLMPTVIVGLLLALATSIGTWFVLTAPAKKIEKEVVPLAALKVTAISKILKVAKAGPIYAWPTLKAQRVGALEVGNKMEVTGETTAEGRAWYRVTRYGGKDGYVLKEVFGN